MLRVRVTIDAGGVLRRMSADGHTGYAVKGADPVCGAASALLLAAARTLEARAGMRVDGDTRERGRLRLEVLEIDSNSAGYARGVTEMLVRGLGDLSREFPGHVELVISRTTEEISENGS